MWRLTNAWWPQTLLARLLLSLGGMTLASLLASSWLWSWQIQNQVKQDSLEAARYLGQAAAATVQYFALLPANYQPLVIDQLREMGGTRFFTILNNELLDNSAPVNSPLAEQSRQRFEQQLNQQLGPSYQLHTFVAWPEGLVISSQGHLLTHLPRQWTEFSLLLQPKPAPIMVAQVELQTGHWLLLASLMPDPYFLDKAEPLLHGWNWLWLALPLFGSLLILIPLVGSASKPLAQLARATHRFGPGLNHEPLPNTGPKEYLELREALLSMEQRIEQFMQERSRLFSAISHDLRTPITRLKLRSELLDDDELAASFQHDLDDLTSLVNSALTSVRDTALEEPIQELQVRALLERLIQAYNQPQERIRLECEDLGMHTKVMAFKRIIDNLISNALAYGQKAEVRVFGQEDVVFVQVRDHGPGVAESDLPQLIQPGKRLAHGQSQHQQGHGLGLTICHNLCLGMGGELTLANHPEGGLLAEVRLPLSLR